MMNGQDKEQRNRLFWVRAVRIVGYIGLAFLANGLVNEFFGGVNPLLEYSSGSIVKIDTIDGKNKAGLGLAYQACKDDLGRIKDNYEFPDQSFEAWNLNEGSYLIESRIYTSTAPGTSTAGNLLCKVLKTEDHEYLAVHWKVQGTQIN